LSADDAVPLVRADPTQVHQLAVNLVANAWHALHGQPGEICINVDSCRVDSTLCAESPELRPGPHVRVSVTDTGCGMDAETLRRIFEPFFTTKPAGLGTGLGLSVAHGIMRSHGGAISVESQLGRGTTFHLYFPMLGPDSSIAETEPLPASVRLGHGEHILYIDDERALVRLTVRLFRRLNYRISGCTRADDALRRFAAEPDKYDLIITDFNMPGMSGMDIARELLKIRPDVPIVLISGYLRAAESEQAQALGIREVLTKPSAVQDLVTVVQRLLTSSQQRT
jgi:CheY-like chemotaxis protein